jgi:soluble lytic murein transglycosylase-like protein
MLGLSALALMAVLYTRPDLARELSQFLAPEPVVVAQVKAPALSALMEAPASPVAAQTAAQMEAEQKALAASEKQQQWVTAWISKRYRVANDATDMLVSTAYLAAHEVKIDPLLILAVMAIESRFNPFAESPVGAQGLMQVMSKVHHAKFEEMGGTQAALNPVANIRVGAQILQEYVKRGGSVEAGLKTYVGAAAFETDQGYGSKVLAEYNRLKLVAKGQQVPTFTPPTPPAIVVDKAAPTAPATPKTEPTITASAGSENIAGL